jgi:hypothetical protein
MQADCPVANPATQATTFCPGHTTIDENVLFPHSSTVGSNTATIDGPEMLGCARREPFQKGLVRRINQSRRFELL